MLKGLFGPSTFLEVGLEEWTLETWAWLMRNLGGVASLSVTPLVLANTEFFPATLTEGEERAAYLFECVKKQMGMVDWACELQPRRRREANARVGEFWFLKSADAPSGTFQAKDNTVVISYAVDLIAQPRALIPVFAHELSHYRLATIAEPIPGGHDAHELATELAAAYAGFGVFAANAAFSFEQHGDAFGQGWKSSRSGYLSERTWAFAIALFLVLKGSPGAAKGQLKPHVAEMVTKAERYLGRYPALIEPLRGIG